ncbi:MAG: helix-turn-helix domain-containing protein [Bacteroidota bacterium]
MRNSRPIPYRLSDIRKMDSLVEHRSKFNLDHCELNIFETRQQASDFHLAFGGFTITSMLRGKKIMHLDGYESFEYLPGETVLAPYGSKMVIDFPEADVATPTQCTALVIDPHYVQQQLTRINERKGAFVDRGEWQLDPEDIFLHNDPELAQLSTRIIQVFSGDDPFKDVYADLMLQQLMVCIIRLQYQKHLTEAADPTRERLANVLQFIRQHLTSDIRVDELYRVAGMSKSQFYRQFTEMTGMTPVKMILEERLRHAKRMLCESDQSIKEVAYSSGFNDPNYFNRIFKKLEGQTPGQYRRSNPASLTQKAQKILKMA